MMSTEQKRAELTPNDHECRKRLGAALPLRIFKGLQAEEIHISGAAFLIVIMLSWQAGAFLMSDES